MVAGIASLISIIPNFVVIVIGRFIYGFASGVLLGIGPKYLDETVPGHVYENGYGISFNLSINVVIVISFLITNFVPENEEDLKTTVIW